jgi:hypothetical protein
MAMPMSPAPVQTHTLLGPLEQLFDAINRMDLPGLQQWVADDFGIVDLST